MTVILDGDQKASGFKVSDHSLAAFIAIHATVLFGHVIVHASGLREDIQHGEVVTTTNFKVIEVMGRRDFHATRTKFTVNIAVSDDRDGATSQRKN